MFNSKKCPHCNNNVKSNFEFCPSCGKQIKNNGDDWGMLGRNDFLEQNERVENPLLSGFGGGMLGKMLNSTMKMLEKELQREMGGMQKSQTQNLGNPNFELFINGKRINPRNIKVTKQPIQENKKQVQEKNKKIVYLPNNKLEKFSKLPQEEPKTSIRRLADSIVCEIELPGVKKEEDLSIRRVGESIEIKAVSKDRAYMKTITINLPVTGYEFSKENLTLELETNN